MNRRIARSGFWGCLFCLFFNLSLPAQTLAPKAVTPVLARVELAGPVESFPMPIQTLLQDSGGKDYLLVIATEVQLGQAGWPWRVLDQNAVAEQYVIATGFRAGAREAASARFTPLLDDGIRWILRATPEAVEELAQLGFELQRLTSEPMVLSRSILRPASRNRELLGPSSMPDPLVSAMVNRVATTNLYWLVRRLTGEEPEVVGGEPRLIATRHTSSGLSVYKALQRVLERLSALGLDVRYTNWSSSGYVNSNVVATLTGAALSNELVLVVAHLDDMPSGVRAPGADDNCSGSAAVLTAAGIFSQYRFDRSIRFVLFTGEEQGLLGSARYAAAAKAAGDNIVAVINLDMIAWNGSAPNTLQLYTRTISTPGYTNDLLIATTFTNAVNAYGLSNRLAPVIIASGFSPSDHSSFWNQGYAAILAIEEYGGDFNPYYHTTNDTLARFNLPYFTASVQAAVATAAHLAGPVAAVPSADAIELVSSDWQTNSGIGAGVLLTRHLPGATETGSDPWDLALTNAPANPDINWLKLTTAPYGVTLVTDSRPTNSETLFTATLTSPTGTVVSCSNRLRFDFPAPPAPDRLYTARILVNGAYLQPTNYLCVTNLRSVVTSGGYLNLPRLTNAPPGSVYGTCEIAARLLDTNRASCRLRLLSLAGSTLELGTDAQISGRIIDELETCTNLAGNNWTWLASYTNDVLPDAASFDSGWKQLTRTVNVSSLPAASQHYFRFRRSWPAP